MLLNPHSFLFTLCRKSFLPLSKTIDGYIHSKTITLSSLIVPLYNCHFILDVILYIINKFYFIGYIFDQVSLLINSGFYLIHMLFKYPLLIILFLLIQNHAQTIQTSRRSPTQTRKSHRRQLSPNAPHDLPP